MFGDITNETTEAIVNTTDFNDFETGILGVGLSKTTARGNKYNIARVAKDYCAIFLLMFVK